MVHPRPRDEVAGESGTDTCCDAGATEKRGRERRVVAASAEETPLGWPLLRERRVLELEDLRDHVGSATDLPLVVPPGRDVELVDLRERGGLGHTTPDDGHQLGRCIRKSGKSFVRTRR